MRDSRLRRLLFTVAVLLVTLAVAAPEVARQPASGHTVKTLEIKILSTMLADQGFGEWGFAALIEVDGRRILFDTGANDDTVQRNLKALGLDLSDVEVVILSHNHADHTTGLMPLRRQFAAKAPTALGTVYAGSGLFWPRIGGKGQVDGRMARIKSEYEATGGRVIDVAKPTEIFPGVWLTGPVPRVHPERNWSVTGQVRTVSGDVEDTVPEDMTLVFQTDKGLVYLFGCGHAGVINTLEHTRKAIDPTLVQAVIGGLHLFTATDAHLVWTAGQLKAFGVQQLMGAHCTGIEAVYRIRALAGLTRQTCMVGAVGASYSLANGINAVRIAK
ncbi:MAG: MBL fold metallo-hydrolase [Acidobacteria bacterium]|nr:MBL fold metallo-hydrolase [Acidobacteriota bacterium]